MAVLHKFERKKEKASKFTNSVPDGSCSFLAIFRLKGLLQIVTCIAQNHKIRENFIRCGFITIETGMGEIRPDCTMMLLI